MKVMFTMKEKIWSFVFCFGIFFPLVCQAIATPTIAKSKNSRPKNKMCH